MMYKVFLLCLCMLANLSLGSVSMAGEDVLQEVKGVISVKGNEPFTYLAITISGQGEYKIVGKWMKSLRSQYQQQQIVVKGIIVKESAGPGFPAELDVIEIVE